MSLHDRIMRFNPDDHKPLPDESADRFDYGFRLAGVMAADLASEADDLMAEMAELLAEANFDNNTDMTEADRLVAKYNTYMERNNER